MKVESGKMRVERRKFRASTSGCGFIANVDFQDEAQAPGSLPLNSQPSTLNFP